MVRPIPLTAALAITACVALGPAAGISHAAPPQGHSHSTPHGAPATPKGTSPDTSTAHAAASPAAHIAANPELVTRLNPLLPAGMTLEQAAQGFRNQGQFIAALHVAHNLDIPFAQIKAQMTGANHDSLGQAIHELKPSADAKAEATKAETEANEDLKTSSKHSATEHDQR